MFSSYLKLAWRNLVRNKIYSGINIAGLALGLACFIMMAMYVLDELSYDRFHTRAKNIYRINTDLRFGGADLKLAHTSDGMGAALLQDFPEVEDFTRIYSSSGSKMIKKGEEFIYEHKIAFADSSFFNVFSFDWIDGDPSRALVEPNTVVLSEAAALKYFGTTNVLGQTLQEGATQPVLYKVTGIIKNMPSNSHMEFDVLLSIKSMEYDWGNFLSHNFSTYLVLRDGTDPQNFTQKINTLYVDKYVLPQAKAYMQINSMEEFKSGGNYLNYSLTPLKRIHLYSDLEGELQPNGNIKYVYIFSAVALFVLLLACINFMNLATARSIHRSKEVGIRKVLGSAKAALIRQFLVEAILMVVIALLLAIVIVVFSIKYFKELSGKEIEWALLNNVSMYLFLLLLPLVIGFLAGLYPAFYLSSFQPLKVLKGIRGGFQKSRLRSGLVVFQFITTIFLVVATIVVYRQLNFIQTTKVGFNREQLLVVNGLHALGNKADQFKQAVDKLSGIQKSAFAGFIPVANSSRSNTPYFTQASRTVEHGVSLQSWQVDYDYVPTLGLEMKQGRNFDPSYGSDSSAVIINETAAAVFGFDDPVGKKLYLKEINGATPGDNDFVTIVGVVKNFNFESLRQQVAPMVIHLGYNKWAAMFRLSSADIPHTLSQIKDIWRTLSNGVPFQFEFMDDTFDSMYRAEQRVGNVAILFTILAICIACLGLFGLAAYMAEQRTKEIGIRKVLGASAPKLAGMLTVDFIKLVVLACVIALPLAYIVMKKWLMDFSYRTELSWWIFLSAAIITLIIAVITVGALAWKAATLNPTESIKAES